MITTSEGPADAAMYYDPEKNATGDHYCFTETTPTYIRHEFVKKVFGIVSLQLLATFGLLAVTYNVAAMKAFFIANLYLGIIAAVVFFISLITISCKPSLARSHKTGIPIVSMMTLCMAVQVTCIAVHYAAFDITVAAGITAVLVICITMFAFQTKYDFTGWIMYMFVIGIGLMVTGILSVIFRNKVLSILYSAAAALFIAIYLIIDIQLVVGGKKNEWTIDDYIIAAICIYSDIISLFLHILRIVGSVSDS